MNLPPVTEDEIEQARRFKRIVERAQREDAEKPLDEAGIQARETTREGALLLASACLIRGIEIESL